MKQKESNVINHSLSEYKKKFGNSKKHLISISKKEVEAFDNKYHTNNNYLLKGRRWWLINDTYYEVPRGLDFSYFKNLNKGVKIAICIFAGAVIASAIVTPVLISVMNSSGIVVDSSKSNEVRIGTITKDDYFTHIPLLTIDNNKEVESADVYIKGKQLQLGTEYQFYSDSQKITITNEFLEKNPGKLVINPKVINKRKEMIISCENNQHNFYYESDEKVYTLKAVDKITGASLSNVTYSESTSNVINLDSKNSNFTISFNAYDSLTITATVDGYKPATYEMEVASFDKLDEASLKEGKVKVELVTPIPSGVNIQLPNRYYDNSKKEWIICNTIEEDAFSNNGDIAVLSISNSINVIDGSAFSNCTNANFAFDLKDDNIQYSYGIKIENDPETGLPVQKADKTMLFNKNRTKLISSKSIEDNLDLTTYDSLKVIGKGAYKGNTNIMSINLPDALLTIGDNAFDGCTNLDSNGLGITLKSNLTSIGKCAFKDTAINSVTFDDVLNWKQKGESGGEIDVSEGSTNATNLKNVTESGDNWGYTGIEKVAPSYDYLTFKKLTANTCSVMAKDGEVIPADLIIPSDDPDSGRNVVSIESEGFKDITTITSITLPTSVTSIGANAFNGCTGITSLNLPSQSSWRVIDLDTENIDYFINSDTSEKIDKLTAANKKWIKNTIEFASDSPTEVKVGKSITLKLKATMSSLVWNSVLKTVATVNNGVVTGVSVGESIIYVDDTIGGQCGAVKITVVA